MENLHVWLLILAGGSIGVLGIFLFASELKNKQQERMKLRGDRSDKAIAGSTSQQAGKHSSAELMTRNKELIEKISSLFKQLEESRRTVDALKTEPARLPRFQTGSQHVHEEMINLKNELEAAQTRFKESTIRYQQAADLNAKLQAEAVELQQQVRAGDETITELKADLQNLMAAQAEYREVCTENQQLQHQIATIREQLQTSEALLATTAGRHREAADRHSALQSQIAESRKRMDQLLMKNQELLEEKTSVSSSLAQSQRTLEELQALQRDAQSENQQLQAAKRALEQEIPKIQIQLQATEARLSDAISQGQEVAARNAKLETQVAGLKQQLQTGQSELEELHSEQQRLASVTLENQQLRNHSAELRNQLQRSEARLDEADRENQEAAVRYARLQNEMINLQDELAEGQTKARALETLEQQLADVQSREMVLTEQQHRLEASIAQLERERSSAAKGKDQELDAAHERLHDLEQLCQELHDENRRLEEETSGLQERLAAGPLMNAPSPLAHTSRLPALQSTTHAAAESTITAIDAAISDHVEQSKTIIPINDLDQNDTHRAYLSRAAEASEIHVVNEADVKQPTRSFGKRSWYFAIVPAMIVLAIAVSFAVGVLDTNLDTFSGSEEITLGPNTGFDEPGASSDTASPKSKRSARASNTPPPENERPRQTVAPRLRGTFKTTRPTQIYSGPSENSALIASVGPGMKINVVSSRDGWLEIRSKHGRPPGFIRQEAAERIEQLN
jgi:chromosome segregation ATPase